MIVVANKNQRKKGKIIKLKNILSINLCLLFISICAISVYNNEVYTNLDTLIKLKESINIDHHLFYIIIKGTNESFTHINYVLIPLLLGILLDSIFIVRLNINKFVKKK